MEVYLQNISSEMLVMEMLELVNGLMGSGDSEWE